MSKYKYTETELQFNKVLGYQRERLEKIEFGNNDKLEKCIVDSEKLLKELGIDLPVKTDSVVRPRNNNCIIVPSWSELCKLAEESNTEDLETLFTEEELCENVAEIKRLNTEYNQIHKLDSIDWAIAVGAGMLGALVDILLVGLPEYYTPDGSSGKPLSTWIRSYFDNLYPKEKIKKLEKLAKVPYDAQHNHIKNNILNINVGGLSPQFHRLLQLGHDPILGFVFGVHDIMNGNMTTIDKAGNVVSQSMREWCDYDKRIEPNIVKALLLQFRHLRSDVATPAGLPVPLMGLFNLFQFGSIGEEEQTIAEIVQGMYYEGYDFVHFCSMSIPMMITEILTRVGYAVKQIKAGKSVKEAVALTVNRDKHPKLGTMLFIAHSAEVAANAGKVYFTQNPCSINYPQWAAFAKYSYQQIKWISYDKPRKREKYVLDAINNELNEVYNDINVSYNKLGINQALVID